MTCHLTTTWNHCVFPYFQEPKKLLDGKSGFLFSFLGLLSWKFSCLRTLNWYPAAMGWTHCLLPFQCTLLLDLFTSLYLHYWAKKCHTLQHFYNRAVYLLHCSLQCTCSVACSVPAVYFNEAPDMTYFTGITLQYTAEHCICTSPTLLSAGQCTLHLHCHAAVHLQCMHCRIHAVCLKHRTLRHWKCTGKVLQFASFIIS